MAYDNLLYSQEDGTAVVTLNRPQRRGYSKARAAKGGPIKVSFDANQKMTSLQVVTELEASDEGGTAGIEVVADAPDAGIFYGSRRNQAQFLQGISG